MRRNLLVLSIMPALLLAPVLAWSAGQATQDEAKAIAIKAAAYLRSVGADKAFPEFNADKGPWRDRDLYVVVMSDQGTMLVNGPNPGLIGKNLIDLRDVDGKPFEREIAAVKDEGWVSFKWRNPVSNAVELKTQHEVRVGDNLVGVGAFAK